MQKSHILYLVAGYLLLYSAFGEFTFVQTHSTGSGINHYFVGWDQIGDSVTFLMDLPPINPMLLYLCTVDDPTSYFQNCSSALSGFSSLMRVKTAKGNVAGGQTQLISYNSTNINHHSSLMTTATPITGVLSPGDLTIDALFGSTISEKFVLVSKTNQTVLSVCYLINNLLINTTLTSVKNSEVLNKSLIHDNKLIYLFNTGIYIFGANSSMQLIKYIPIPISSRTINMDIYLQYLVYACDYQYVMLNMTDYSTILSNNETQLISDIKIMDQHYIIISTINYIYQYDIQIGYKISNVSYLVRNQKFGLFTRKYLIFHYQFPIHYKLMTVYNISYSYSCDGGCTRCMDTYYINLTDYSCIKNTSANVKLKININQITLVSTALAIASVRVATPKSFAVVTYFADELQYYNFHHCIYPQNLSSDFDKAKVVNQLRIKPSFMSFIDIFFSSEIGEKENKDYWKQIPYDERNPDKIYFLNSTEAVYKANALMNILAFAFIKMLALIFGCFRDRHRFLRVMYMWAWTRSRWWMLVTMFMEANVMELTFSSLMQFLVSSNFVFWNKINFFISIIVLFLVLAYVLSFYPLIYEYSNRKSAETLLIRTKYSLGSFFIEPLYSIVFNFIRAFIHSLLLNFYSTQILCLTIVDSVFLLLIFPLATLFINKITFVCNLLVLVSRLVFDLFLCLNDRNIHLFHLFRQQNYDKLIQRSLLVHIGFFLTLTIAIFLVDFTEFAANYNKINMTQKQKVNMFLKKENQFSNSAQKQISLKKSLTNVGKKVTIQLHYLQEYGDDTKAIESYCQFKQNNLSQSSKNKEQQQIIQNIPVIKLDPHSKQRIIKQAKSQILLISQNIPSNYDAKERNQKEKKFTKKVQEKKKFDLKRNPFYHKQSSS